ncbi:NAD-dependent epimerase/dehydratase family protein (plasmid) [Devosia neptuniae]|uniref:NAD-dependent epimerase/dehydratase family protein n=1 Tax=Devosia neptuniae TaxID=191302 RepID=A0ABY6CA21_9HYPH|nr:NAD-dependent epimerase/dehydratase family protein [Devosia neptuniae]UXN67841.1 NAD-dependent epimerase/dehydratase family protein [Devosia neptuniae]
MGTELKPDRILITGANGFVGRHMVSHLLSSSDANLRLAVRSLVPFPTTWTGNGRIEIVETGPIETSDSLASALQDVTVVCHLAGLAHAPRAKASDFFLSNAVATERLVRAAEASGSHTFIHLSSLAAITRNSSSSVINDSTNELAASPYGASKKLAEQHVAAFAHSGKFAVSIRPPLVVGPDARGNWAQLQRLAATGLPLPFASVQNRRAFIGIETLVSAIGHLCSRQWTTAESGNYCVADLDTLSLPEVVTALRQGMGIGPRLIAIPPGLISTIGRWLGKAKAASGLLGDLDVDASRFNQTFDFIPPKRLLDSIVASGHQYRRTIENTQNGIAQ